MDPSEGRDVNGFCADWDAAVEADPEIDPFCSRSAWQLSFSEAFSPERTLFLSGEGGDYVVLAESKDPEDGFGLEPVENMWGLGSSLIGSGAAEHLVAELRHRPRPTLLMGVPLNPQRLSPLQEGLGEHFLLQAGLPSTRWTASLEGGFEGWLSRRSASFRRNLRASERRSQTEKIRFRWFSDISESGTTEIYRSILDVESRSWKAEDGVGVDQGPMEAFYKRLLPRVARAGHLRVLLAEWEGETVGYLHGAHIGSHFRGLQFSFDARFSRVGLGNLLQNEALKHLSLAGAATYDLGSQNEYKEHWSEEGLTTCAVWIQPT